MTTTEHSRVLVTGATGFLGRSTLALLAARGLEVHVVSRASPMPAGAVPHEADLLVADERERLIATVAPTHLLHLAWHYRPRDVWHSLENLRWMEATSALLREFVAGGGRRALLAGTCFEYDPRAEVCNETGTPLLPTTLYGACKAATGSALMAASSAAGLSAAWGRIFLAYGPGEHPQRLVASVICNLLAGREAPVSHGRQVRDYLFSEDIGDALVELLLSDVTGPVNVGSGEGVELRDLIGRVAELAGRPELVRLGAIEPPFDEPPVIVADVARLRDEVGWTPRHSLDAGLERTVAWWREGAGAN